MRLSACLECTEVQTGDDRRIVDRATTSDMHCVARSSRVWLTIHRVTPAGFRRHLVGKTPINVCHCDLTEIRSVSKSMLIRTFFL